MGKIELARQILDILRREEARAGFHIREQWLADELGISRSPVRTALKQLEQMKVVRSEQNQGYFLEIEPGSEAFGEVVRRAPDDPHRPQALFSGALAKEAAGDAPGATLWRRLLREQFPDNPWTERLGSADDP